MTMELAAFECLKVNVSQLFSRLLFIRTFQKLSGNEDIYYILDEWVFWPDVTADPWVSIYTLYTYMYWGKWCLNFFLNCFFTGWLSGERFLPSGLLVHRKLMELINIFWKAMRSYMVEETCETQGKPPTLSRSPLPSHMPILGFEHRPHM